MTRDMDFDFLDDFALAVARKRVSPHSYLSATKVNRLGPLLELFVLHRSQLLSFDALPFCQTRRALHSALTANHLGSGTYIATTDARMGFITTGRNPHAEDQAKWIAFCLKGQEAALFASLVGAGRILTTRAD